MKIVYVTSRLPHSSKSSQAAQEALIIPEIQELKRRGHEVLVVPMNPRGPVRHGEAKPMLQYSAVEPLVSTSIMKTVATELGRSPAKALKVLGWMFQSRNSRILAKNLAVYPKGLWLAQQAREWGADHIHAHWAGATATLALVAGELANIPWSITAHRYDIPENSLLNLKAQRACFFRAEDKQGAHELLGYIRSNDFRPVMLHMGVPLPPPATRRKISGGQKPPRIVVPANLVEKKGHAYLLGAVQLLKGRSVRVDVDLAGDGPLREELQRRVKELGIEDQITFLGALPHDGLMRQMRAGAWDMVILPSIVTASGEKEGIPVALIEALSCQMPTISTTTGGIPELFEGMEDALVPPEDPQPLAYTIERLLFKEPDLRENLAGLGRRRVEEGFAIEKIVDELTQRFEACSRGKR